VFVITSNVSAVVRDCLARNSVAGVRGVLGADVDPGQDKQDPARHEPVPGAAGYYVGDTRGDMIEGRAGGARTVAVTWGWHRRARLAPAIPDYWADQPSELAETAGRGRGLRMGLHATMHSRMMVIPQRR